MLLHIIIASNRTSSCYISGVPAKRSDMLLGIIVKQQTEAKKPGVPATTAAAPVNRDLRQRKVPTLPEPNPAPQDKDGTWFDMVLFQ